MSAPDIVNDAIEKYDPSHILGLFSGGHDSLCACHIASRHPRFTGCIHINTGIGVEETRHFVRDTCRRYGWPLREYTPPESYESLVMEHGFPGPAHHWKMYSRLKERCLRQVLRDYKDPQNKRRKVVFVSGRRKQESQRRMVNVSEAITVGAPGLSMRPVWCNPLIDWDGGDKHRYMHQHKLPSNPVVETLCMSGECLCGAFAKPGELEEIRTFYPAAAAQIDRIAERVRAAGKHAIWGQRPPRPEDMPDSDQLELPLCVSCGSKWQRSLSL